MKALYQKISNDNESLKGLWAAKLNLKGKGGTVSKEDMDSFDAKKKVSTGVVLYDKNPMFIRDAEAV